MTRAVANATSAHKTNISTIKWSFIVNRGSVGQLLFWKDHVEEEEKEERVWIRITGWDFVIYYYICTTIKAQKKNGEELLICDRQTKIA